jgi:hypothetical protein
MIQVYKGAIKARVTSLRARRVAECFQRHKCFKGPYKRVSYGIFYYTCTTILKILTKKSKLKYVFRSNLCH